jgi:hypothetical protein
LVNWSDKPVVPSMIVGAVAGAVAGGIATHALSASPSACAPTTGVALAFPYILLLAIPLDCQAALGATLLGCLGGLLDRPDRAVEPGVAADWAAPRRRDSRPLDP